MAANKTAFSGIVFRRYENIQWVQMETSGKFYSQSYVSTWRENLHPSIFFLSGLAALSLNIVGFIIIIIIFLMTISCHLLYNAEVVNYFALFQWHVKRPEN